MNHSFTYVVIGIGALLLSGCANNIYVTYDSDPSGAVLYSGNQKYGYTPYTLQYPLLKEDKARGYALLTGASVRWASGATAEISTLRADINQHGLNHSFTFQRPSNVAGREIDAQFALQLEQTRAMQQQAAAQQQQAATQQQAAAQEKRAQDQQNKMRFCNSTVNGRNIDTICY